MTAMTDRIHAFKRQIERLPRFPLCHAPTPLEFVPRFSKALGGPRIYIKRDDCTGLACGGNKARHNEFLIGDALEKGADIVVWGAGVQSNNCRQTAAACAKAGLDCHLVLGRGKAADGPDHVQGNLLLDQLVGAVIDIVDEEIGPDLDRKIADKRIYPAIDITKSGTRKEELLVERGTLSKMWMLRRIINPMGPIDSMEFLLSKFKESKTNAEFFNSMNS